MTTPGPDHPITLEPAANRWRVNVGGHVIADSDAAVILRETTLPARVYFPRQDVAMEYMSRTEKLTHCPYKGDASYYTLFIDGELLEDVAWSYEAPLPAMEAIAGRICFYPERVELYEVTDAAVNPDPAQAPREARTVTVDEVVQHTDAGDGTSQRERWAPNAQTPGVTDDGGLR